MDDTITDQESQPATPAEEATQPLTSATSRLTLVGVGGMGVHTVDLLLDSCADFAHVVAVDTDQTVLDHARAPRKVQIGARLTRGHGTGGDSGVGRRAANGDFPQLRELFHNPDLVILITGLGGGVGSGATPVLAQTARDEGALVLTVAAMPFEFEGDDRLRTAKTAVDRLKATGHGVVLIPNQALFGQSEPTHPLEESFRQAANQLGAGFRWLWHLLGQRNLIHLDWMSLKNMLESCDGLCHVAIAEAGGQNRSTLLLTRLRKHLSGNGTDLPVKNSHVLIGLQGSPDMTLQEVQEVVDGVMLEFPDGAKRSVGAGIDTAMKGRIGAMLLYGEEPAEEAATSSSPPRAKPRKQETKAGKKVTEQKELGLSTAPLSKGRFKDVEPTVVQGEDLDLPTFIRRGMKLSR